MGIIVPIVGIFLVGTAYLLSRAVPYLWKIYTLRKTLLKLIPAEPHHWLYGHLHIFKGLNEEMLKRNVELVTKYPRYYLFLVGPIRTIVNLNHPETIKAVAKTAEPKQIFQSGGYDLLYPWIGDGLLVSTGAKWFRNRKLLTPGFHFDVLKPYVGIYNECVEIMMDKLEQQATETGKSVEIFQPVGLCSLDIILRCAFSASKDVQRSTENRYVKTVATLAKQLLQRNLTPYLYPDWIYYRTQEGSEFKANCNYSHEVAMEVINKRKTELASSSDKSHKNRYVDFLDILLLAKDEDGMGLSTQEILDEVETFMFEGHDTTASGISWILYNLARHPDIQTRVQEEIDALLEGRENDIIQWSDLTELPYFTQCIKESLRLHPPVPFIGRELTKPMKIDDKMLPVGSLVDICIWNVHHNPAVWENPMEYDPDRFTLEKVTKMDSYAFIPFSAGPRNCIGQNFAMNEMKSIVARMLRRFRLTIDVTKEVRMKPEVVLRAENGIHLFLEKRTVV